MIEIKTTCKNKKEAENISKTLLSERLVVCASYFEIESYFLWKSKTEKGKEAMIILKTNEKQKDKAVRRIKELSTYELPVITWNEVNATKDVKDWVNNSV